MVVARSTRFQITAKVGGKVQFHYGTQITADAYARAQFAVASHAPCCEDC